MTSVAAVAKTKKTTVTFAVDTKVNETLVKSGTYEVVFNEATGEVSIQKGRKVVAKVTGRLEKRDSKGRSTEIHTIKHGDVPAFVGFAFGGSDQKVVFVERELLTPRGLRTLAPTDANYSGRCEGDPRSRDGAYHQGNVWPWLMGPFITAYVKTFGRKAGQDFANEWLSQFQVHLKEACLGRVSEIFDGDAPHTPRGCIAQAWSVAELLRSSVLPGDGLRCRRKISIRRAEFLAIPFQHQKANSVFRVE